VRSALGSCGGRHGPIGVVPGYCTVHASCWKAGALCGGWLWHPYVSSEDIQKVELADLLHRHADLGIAQRLDRAEPHNITHMAS